MNAKTHFLLKVFARCSTLKECLVHFFLCSILAKVLNFEVF